MAKFREPVETRSLAEAQSSIVPPTGGRWIRRAFAFAGPGYLVSVGYMDPGNWGTDMAGGSQFGYKLLWVIFLSNLIAQFLQVLCARLGLATGKDLAMACRDYYKRPVVIVLWILCELAIIACDLAEVIGSAVALQLLFNIPLELGVLITGFDVLALLAFSHIGFRKIEAIVVTLVMTVFGCFLYEMTISRPDWPAVLRGTFIPALPNSAALLVAVGILGATVMPHNLYLHSSLVQTRKVDDAREGILFNTWDTIIALSLAFLVNAAILVLSAAMFHGGGQVVTDLAQGHDLLRASLGGASATVFAVALLASGQSSTITGTLAGQIVMEGFMHWRIKPWIRRLVTRCLAIVPALVIIHFSGGASTIDLLVLSQVVLSLQLPFAVFPLISVTSDARHMGEFVNSLTVKVAGYLVGVVIAILNAVLLWFSYRDFQSTHHSAVLPILLAVAGCGALGFLLYVMVFYRESNRGHLSAEAS